MPLPVLFVHHTSVLGGAERSLLELALDLRRGAAFDPALALPVPGTLSDAAAAAGVPVERAPLAHWPRRAGWLRRIRDLARVLPLTLRLRSILKGRGARLVHANSTLAALQAAPAATISRRPLVWQLRDRLPPRLILRILRRFVRVAISLTDEAAQTLREAGFEARAIPNGIDTDAFPRPDRAESRRALGLSPDAPVVLCAAQLVPWKRQPELLEGFAVVRRTLPAALLLLAGQDPHGAHPDLQAALRARADRPDLAGAVSFLGQRDDVPALLAACDLVAHPAREEPFGRIFLESGAARRCVVCADGPGPRAVVAPACPSAVLRDVSPEPLAAAILERLRRPDLARAEAEALDRRVREAFPRAAVSARVARLYEEIL